MELPRSSPEADRWWSITTSSPEEIWVPQNDPYHDLYLRNAAEWLPEYPIACDWALTINNFSNASGMVSIMGNLGIIMGSKINNTHAILQNILPNFEWHIYTRHSELNVLDPPNMIQLMNVNDWETIPTWITIKPISLPWKHGMYTIGIYHYAYEVWGSRSWAYIGTNFITNGGGWDASDIIRNLREVLNMIYYGVPNEHRDDKKLLVKPWWETTYTGPVSVALKNTPHIREMLRPRMYRDEAGQKWTIDLVTFAQQYDSFTREWMRLSWWWWYCAELKPWFIDPSFWAWVKK